MARIFRKLNVSIRILEKWIHWLRDVDHPVIYIYIIYIDAVDRFLLDTIFCNIFSTKRFLPSTKQAS